MGKLDMNLIFFQIITRHVVQQAYEEASIPSTRIQYVVTKRYCSLAQVAVSFLETNKYLKQVLWLQCISLQLVRTLPARAACCHLL